MRSNLGDRLSRSNEAPEDIFQLRKTRNTPGEAIPHQITAMLLGYFEGPGAFIAMFFTGKCFVQS